VNQTFSSSVILHNETYTQKECKNPLFVFRIEQSLPNKHTLLHHCETQSVAAIQTFSPPPVIARKEQSD
jgi:hypothetical protein